jgi:hypothetical protein
MRPEETSYMFNFTYIKSSTEIIGKAKIKVEALRAKITEREQRILKTRKEYDITDAMLVDLLTQARKQNQNNRASNQTYSVSKTTGSGSQMTEETVTIGAGVVNLLFTEMEFIESEKSEAKRLELIIRNLRDIPDQYDGLGHALHESELTYLGF